MKKISLLFIALLFPLVSIAQVFNVEDIRVEGLQRVSAGSVFSVLPVRVGELADEVLIQDSVRALFKTGFFDNIRVGRDGNVLVIFVSERPAISEINLDGNKIIKDEDLLNSLNDNGLSEGQIFKPATLDGLTKSLSREYVSQGLYGSNIETEIRQLPRNRVAVDITIEEGKKAKIRSIQLVGNEDFRDKELLDLFESTKGGWLSWITGDNKYAREKLSGDLERLESHYLDRGYVQFEIDSTQVSVSPDKTSVFITVNISEGDVYTVSDVGLLGEMVVDQRELERYLIVREGQTFSQSIITSTKELLAQRLGNEGYTFAEINEIVDTNEDDKTVDITFFVDPQKRVYVRRIEFRGNTRTEDRVLRREMRQMESAIASDQLVEFGKIRLDRLGFFKEVESETIPVPGTSDQVDVIYTVEEQTSGSISASIGYADDTGAIIGLNLQENNFLGTGDRVGIGINRSRFQESLSLSYSDPYYTADGVSAGFSVFARKTDFGEIQVASFTTNTYGVNLNFGYPLSEISRLNFGIGLEQLDLDVGVRPSAEIVEFGGTDGDKFNQLKLQAGWTRSTLNRGIFATRGDRQTLSLEIASPGSDAPYYKIGYDAQKFVPLTRSFTVKFSTNLGYGESFESGRRLPFFENYFAGGFGTVRGFESNTLGPRESPFVELDAFGNPTGGTTNNGGQVGVDPDPDPIGGNVLATARAELLLPIPFLKDSRSVQAALFIDAGNVFDTKCGVAQSLCFKPSIDELRYSGGLGITWLSGFGPMSFAFAKAKNSGLDEEREFFQFSLGQTF